MRHLALALCLAVATFPLPAHADSFRYTFSLNQPDSPTFFTAESPTLITDAAVLSTTTCSDFLPGFPHPTPSCDSIALQHLGANAAFGWAVFFDLGADSVGSLCCVPSSFFDLGDHESPAFRTSVVDESATITPEPSSFALLGTGLVALSGLRRQRHRAASR